MSAIAAPTGVRFEHRTDDGRVLGIGTSTPRLSWIVPAAAPTFAQEACEIEVTRGGEAEVFRVAGPEQVLVPWPAAPLASSEAVVVRVRVVGGGAVSEWSEAATVEAGLLRAGDWTARFVSPVELGAVADWLHRTVAGLAPAAPGYRRLLVQPRPTRRLTRACARHRTPYGDAEAGWERADGTLVVRAVVPVGATAIVHLPGDEQPLEVGHGTHEWRRPDPWDGNGARDLATIRDVLDDEPAWERVVAAAREVGAIGGEAEAAGKLTAYLDRPAGVPADALAPRGLAEPAEELRERLSGVIEN